MSLIVDWDVKCQNNTYEQTYRIEVNSAHHSYLCNFALKCLRQHYENAPMQYTVFFFGCKNGKFQLKKKKMIFFLFLLQT